MHTASSCALRASSAKLASATRLSREYSVCMCMSRRTRSMRRESAAGGVPRPKSGPDALHVVDPAESEDLDDFRYVVGPRGVGRRGTHPQGRPRSSARVEGRTSDVAGLPSACDRRGEPLMRLYP